MLVVGFYLYISLCTSLNIMSDKNTNCPGIVRASIRENDYVFSARFQRPYICFSKPGCDLSNNGIIESYLNSEISTVSHEDLESDIMGFKASFG